MGFFNSLNNGIIKIPLCLVSDSLDQICVLAQLQLLRKQQIPAQPLLLVGDRNSSALNCTLLFCLFHQAEKPAALHHASWPFLLYQNSLSESHAEHYYLSVRLIISRSSSVLSEQSIHILALISVGLLHELFSFT